MSQLELSAQDIQNLLAIINGASIKGEAVETIAVLKQKLTLALQPAGSGGGTDGKVDQTSE